MMVKSLLLSIVAFSTALAGHSGLAQQDRIGSSLHVDTEDNSRDSHRQLFWLFNRQRAITMWWVIFNNPENCIISNECGLPDVGALRENVSSNPAGVGVAFATGGVPDFRGNLRLIASTYLTKMDPLVLDVDPNAADAPRTWGGPRDLGTVWNNPSAQVALVIRDHGSAESNPEALRAQLTQFNDPFCSLNDCFDIGLAGFGALSDGYTTVSIGCFPPSCEDDGEAGSRQLEPSGNTATLIKTGDSLQAYVEIEVPWAL